MVTPTVKLLGENGNIFFILGRCQKEAKKAGWSKKELNDFTNKVTSADNYDHALQIVMEYFEVE